MKNYTLVLLALAFMTIVQFTITSCQYKNEEEFFCDTSNVTYSVTITKILQDNCYRCHGKASNSKSGGIILEDYNVLKTFAADGRFYGNAAHLPNYIPMPFDGGMLTDCQIRQIKNWVDKGYPQN